MFQDQQGQVFGASVSLCGTSAPSWRMTIVDICGENMGGRATSGLYRDVKPVRAVVIDAKGAETSANRTFPCSITIQSPTSAPRNINGDICGRGEFHLEMRRFAIKNICAWPESTACTGADEGECRLDSGTRLTTSQCCLRKVRGYDPWTELGFPPGPIRGGGRLGSLPV